MGVRAAMDKECEAVCAMSGRPSVPPERLLKALRLPILFTVRSERLLVEGIECNLLYRGFVGLSIDDPVWGTPPSAATAIACSVGGVFPERARARDGPNGRGPRQFGVKLRQSRSDKEASR